MYSPSIKNLIRALKRLPSVGERTAERFVFHWLKSGKKEVTELMLALKELVENIKSCETCWDFSDNNPCPICSDQKRDRSTICVVAESQDLMVIEQTGVFHGVYHVLRDLIDAGDEESFTRIKAKELLSRIEGKSTFNKEVPVKEVIVALNPDLAGETTALFLEQEIKVIAPKVKVTRLARGLPLGADLRYADEVTLGSAIKNRTSKS
jgi:recombination protein RecR